MDVVGYIRLKDEPSARLALAKLLQEESDVECYIPAILEKAESVGMSLADLATGGGPCDENITEEVSQMFWQASFSTALDERCEPIRCQ